MHPATVKSMVNSWHIIFITQAFTNFQILTHQFHSSSFGSIHIVPPKHLLLKQRFIAHSLLSPHWSLLKHFVGFRSSLSTVPGALSSLLFPLWLLSRSSSSFCSFFGSPGNGPNRRIPSPFQLAFFIYFHMRSSFPPAQSHLPVRGNVVVFYAAGWWSLTRSSCDVRWSAINVGNIKPVRRYSSGPGSSVNFFYFHSFPTHHITMCIPFGSTYILS